jgi:ferrous iron transport protein B
MIGQENDLMLSEIQRRKESRRQELSFIARIGHFIEPVMRPLGFDWKMSICLIAGGAAKEIVVSTMGVLYATGESENDTGLISKIREQTYKEGPRSGEKVFTPLVAFSFMIFVLIYFPCVAVLAAVKKESGAWKWALFVAVYTTGLAWVMSFLVYQVGGLF